MANPAARTAADWNRPAARRVPIGISSMTSLPRSKTMKLNQSIILGVSEVTVIATYVNMMTTKTKNQVCVDGKR